MGIPEKLNTVGLKATAQRLQVLHVFEEHERRHLTADDIYDWTAKHGPQLGRATIYRVLNHLTEVGMLTRTLLDARAAYYELQSKSHHHHLVCRGCDRVEEFTDPRVHERARKIAQSNGYAISHCDLALYGYCSRCRPSRAR